MREVTYYINDHEFMRELYKDAPNLDSIMSGLSDPFVCVYTLKGLIVPGYPTTEYSFYELKDVVGRKIDMDDLKKINEMLTSYAEKACEIRTLAE